MRRNAQQRPLGKQQSPLSLDLSLCHALMCICLYSHLQRFFHLFYMAQWKEQTVMCPSAINFVHSRKESDRTEQLSAHVRAQARAHTHTHTHPLTGNDTSIPSTFIMGLGVCFFQ